MVADREVKQGLGLPAQAAAVAAKEAAGLLSALLAPCAAAGRCSQKEVESLALSLAKACFEAFKAGATKPEKEVFGSIKQPGSIEAFLRFPPEAAAWLLSEAEKASVSKAVVVRWAVAEQARLAGKPFQASAQEARVASRKEKV